MNIDVCSLSAIELSQAIHDRKISCVDVMKAFLDRIERFNQKVNALVNLAPRQSLLAQAKELDDGYSF